MLGQGRMRSYWVSVRFPEEGSRRPSHPLPSLAILSHWIFLYIINQSVPLYPFPAQLHPLTLPSSLPPFCSHYLPSHSIFPFCSSLCHPSHSLIFPLPTHSTRPSLFQAPSFPSQHTDSTSSHRSHDPFTKQRLITHYLTKY